MPPSLLLSAVLPVYAIALFGMFLRRVKVVTPEMDKGFLRLTIHFLYPCLIWDKMLGNPLIAQPAVVASGIGVGFGLIVVGFAIAYAVGAALGLRVGSGIRTFALSAGVQNFGFVAVPIVLALYANPDTLGLLFVHSLGVELCLWTVGLMLLKGSLKPDFRLFLNGPIIAVIVGLILVYSGLGKYLSATGDFLPGTVVRQSLSLLGACSFPLAILLIGATIYDLIGQEKFSGKISLVGLLVRSVLLPGVILVAAKYLPLILELKQVLVVQAAMPAAVTPIIIARHYGGRPGITVQIILITSLAGIATIPFILSWGARWVL